MVHLDGHYVDERLVALYDLENARGADTDFYLGLADAIGARTILDLGCGTGLLTCEMAVAGRRVIGVDPAPAMLAVARRAPGGERVRWVEGDASALGTPEADLLTMTGNVAQIFLEDDEWGRHPARDRCRAPPRRHPGLREPQPRRPGVGALESRGDL